MPLKFVDLSDTDLNDLDLSSIDLSYANLYRTNLSRTNLSRANLYRTNLSRTNLSRANLSDANLSYAFFYGANLNGANLNDVDLSDAKYESANLTLTRFENNNIPDLAQVQRYKQTVAFFVGAILCLNDLSVQISDYIFFILRYITPEDLIPAITLALQHVEDGANAHNIAPIGFCCVMVRNSSLALDQKQAGTVRLLTYETVQEVENQDVINDHPTDENESPAEDQQVSKPPASGLFQSGARVAGPQTVAPTRVQRDEEQTNMCRYVMQ